MLRFEEITTDTLSASWSESTVHQGLIAMLAIGLALLLGAVTGHPAAGAIAAGGAFTAGFAVFHPVLESPLISMLVVTAGMASATLAGSLSAKWTVAVLVVVGIGALNYGLLSGLGASAGWIGQQSAVFLVIATYFPNGPRYALGRASMVLLGGLLQTIIHAAFLLRREPSYRSTLVRTLLARAREYCSEISKHVSWGSETLGYAGRLIATMLIATAIYRHMHLANGYWVPMTALLVLRPQWTGTVSRSSARVLGTLSGAAVTYGLAHVHGFPYWLVTTLVAVCAFGCYALQAVNYALFSLIITMYIVFLFRFGGFSETAAAHLRLLNTAIGGALALVIDVAWLLIARALRRRTRTVTAA